MADAQLEVVETLGGCGNLVTSDLGLTIGVEKVDRSKYIEIWRKVEGV